MAPTSTMAAEIAEQPAAVARTLQALRPLRGDLRRLAASARLVTFIARGSSDNAATYGRYLCEVHAGRPASLAAPSVATHYRARVDLGGALAVALSQSGETGEIVETLRWAATSGSRTVAITNDGASSLAGAADLALVTQAGPERAVPATKTYTSQLAALAELGAALGPHDPAFDAALAAAPGEIEAMLATAADAAALAGQLAETATHSLVGEAVPALLVAPGDGPVLAGMAALARTVAARGSRASGIGGDGAFAAACTATLPGPDLPEALARGLGFDPDRPVGLSKLTQTSGAVGVAPGGKDGGR
jgi:glutamine---fructose-6-phosphate transaminase (isomerizing)